MKLTERALNYSNMVSDSVMFAVIIGGFIIWVGLWIAEVYNRCKKRRGIKRRLLELGYDPLDHT